MKPGAKRIEETEGATLRCGKGRVLFSSVLESHSSMLRRHRFAEISTPTLAFSCSTCCPVILRLICVEVRLTVCAHSWLKIRLLMRLLMGLLNLLVVAVHAAGPLEQFHVVRF